MGKLTMCCKEDNLRLEEDANCSHETQPAEKQTSPKVMF